ncbi:Hypothetical predicted protein [Lecanosticta acicola]|uniref:Uncharacterized protein n=1 Tax=Lecanosticta acicola TaxID=111012 RepID=A0AAI8YYE2_9PEZI|nr:Hypothetical predicted protein [Lecanosticta acicola]
MAAYQGPAIGRASLDGGSRLEQLLLPNGACSYRDLNAGVQAPTCGCRRFWLNTSTVIDDERERAWCFCGHHACFHDTTCQVQNGWEAAGNEPNVFPSSHQVNSSGQAGGFVAPTWSELIGENRSTGSRQENLEIAPARSTTGLGIGNVRSQSPSIHSRLWQALNGFARQQDDGPNSGDTSRLPSTAVPSVYNEQRASPPRDIQARPQRSRSMGPPVNIPPININENGMDEYSATEVATPSVHGTPDFRALTAPGAPLGPSPVRRSSPARPRAEAPSQHQDRSHQAQPNEVRISNVSLPRVPTGVSVGPSLSIQEMCNTIEDYGRRINLLETVSFSHMPPEEVQDKFDFLDGRVLDLETFRRDQDKAQENDDTEQRLSQLDARIQDLEGWRDDRETQHSSQESNNRHRKSSSKKRRLLPDDEDAGSIASDGSFDENAAAQTEAVVLATLAANAETGPRIDALESRIAEIENATLPSYARPWHIQVVILPFGRDLPGVWFSASESSRHSLQSATEASEKWPAAQNAFKSSFRSVESSGWTTESIEAWNRQCANGDHTEWLSPKACGPTGAVFQRLASRGLVRDITVHAPDARHIFGAISQAFGDVLPYDEGGFNAATVKKYCGLRERFVPLRKVRKSTRLRFLSPAEMVTPATWTADFLDSVFMKVNDGERRLYLTTPSGYLQAHRPGWSWPSLRDLPTYDADGELQAAEDEGRLIDSCWTYNQRLDQASSLHSSFASHDSAWDTSSEVVGQDDGDKEDLPMLSPSATRHSHMRSASLPSSIVNLVDAEPVQKRRVTSFEHETTFNMEYSPEYIAKRRRISTSPELERRGVNFTPRWSREPPSPNTAEEVGRSSQLARARGTTPFAYATPHSNLDSRGGCGDGDTVANSDDDNRDGNNEMYGEEWQGVQEDQDQDQEVLIDSPEVEEKNKAIIEGLIDQENSDGGDLSLWSLTRL